MAINDDTIRKFKKLAALFKEHKFNLYLVGGAARDYLLDKKINNIDCATDATPDEMKSFLTNANYTFAKFGCIAYQEIDITTFRFEDEYIDSRHPHVIKFIRNIKDDSTRRDFTINAIYIDSDLNTYDFFHSINDLNKKIIRFIGNPKIRIMQDPLRMVRAARFAKLYGFFIEEKSLKAIKENLYLLKLINNAKINEEEIKAGASLEELFDLIGIKYCRN